MSRPLLTVSQSDCLMQVVDTNLHTEWQAVQISWLQRYSVFEVMGDNKMSEGTIPNAQYYSVYTKKSYNWCLIPEYLYKVTQQAHNVETTSIQRLDVESTLFGRCEPAGKTSLGRLNTHDKFSAILHDLIPKMMSGFAESISVSGTPIPFYYTMTCW